MTYPISEINCRFRAAGFNGDVLQLSIQSWKCYHEYHSKSSRLQVQKPLTLRITIYREVVRSWWALFVLEHLDPFRFKLLSSLLHCDSTFRAEHLLQEKAFLHIEPSKIGQQSAMSSILNDLQNLHLLHSCRKRSAPTPLAFEWVFDLKRVRVGLCAKRLLRVGWLVGACPIRFFSPATFFFVAWPNCFFCPCCPFREKKKSERGNES